MQLEQRGAEVVALSKQIEQLNADAQASVRTSIKARNRNIL